MRSRLTLLGPVGLTDASGATSRRASQQRRIALLAILAASPDSSVSRDRLLGLLWPDRDDRIARHLLADSLYVLRQTLGDDAFIVSGEAIRLSREHVWADVAEFRCALAGERWTDALDLYRGEFLDAFYVRDATDFELWARAERGRLRDLATRAASSLAQALAAAGRMAEAVAAAERALELAPSDEPVCRELLRLLIATNNRARAEVVACAFVERLAVEVGVAPSGETMRLVREAGAMSAAEPIVVVRLPTARGRRAHAMDSTTAGIIVQARYQWQQRTPASIERAIGYFARAAERDARSAEAWSGHADAWIVMGGRGYARVADAVEYALPSAERALAIDDTLSASHTSMGGLNILRRRWDDASKSLRRAIEIDPHNANAHHWLALTLMTGFGDPTAAMREQTITARLNPASAIQISALGLMHYLRGDYELSRSSLEVAFDLNADLEEGHAGLARVAARLGDEATAVETIAAALARRGDIRGDLLAEHASALAVLGDSRRARQLARAAAAQGGMPLHLAFAWASLGDPGRAFEALAHESFRLYWTPQAVWWDPRFDGMRDDRRFARVRQRVAQAWKPEWT
jgi:DNA-binding SARP family transcriptional activator